MDNSAQIDYWNGEAGQKWVRDADLMDAMLAPFAQAVSDASELGPGMRVTDIGCGAGALSFLLCAGLPDLQVTGVDVSSPLVELARERAARMGSTARFTVADASGWQPEALADAVVSRFGVMFFAEPAPAFANIRMGVRTGGRMVFACWRSLAENAWAHLPLQAALPLLGELPSPPDPRTPGPFAFADPAYLRSNLEEAGWSDIEITEWNGTVVLPGTNVTEATAFMLSMGPLARLVSQLDIPAALVAEAVATRLETMADPDGRIRLPAAAWIAGARA